jgi:hypothetical protein
MKETIKTRWNAFCQASLSEKCGMIAFFCVCLFMLDCSFSGGGHFIEIGPLTPRMLLILVALAASVPLLLKNATKLLKNPVCIAVLLFLVYLAFSAVRGYVRQNRMDVWMSDIKGFAWLFLIPVFMVVLNNKQRFRTVLNCILVGAVIQAVLVFVINVVCTMVYRGIAIFYSPMMDMQFGTVSIISSNLYRIFMRSNPYMVVACAVAVYRQVESKKLNKWYIAVTVLCLNALLLSFTRSVYGCVFVVLVCVAVAVLWLHKDRLVHLLKVVAVTGVFTFLLVFSQEFVLGGNYLNFAVSRVLGTEVQQSLVVSLRSEILDWITVDDPVGPPAMDDAVMQEDYVDLTEISDELRRNTQRELMAIIKDHWVLGDGLGASAPCRNGPDEYFYLDVLARMGIVGLFLYLLPFGCILWRVLRRKKELDSFKDGVAALCGLMGFWAITWFNPWMNAVLGIACYALCGAVYSILSHTQTEITLNSDK